MTDKELALDATDEAFRQAVIQFTKNAATVWEDDKVLEGLKTIISARVRMRKLIQKTF